MGCTSCGKSAGKSKSSMPKSMSGVSKAKSYTASTTGGTGTYGKPRITFSGRNR